MRKQHQEKHNVSRVGWLRAAVLGANDGLVSTASLIVGVAASSAASHEILIAGTAGLVAGAMSMAAGEYVSVSSQADAENADLEKERRELREQPEFELDELTQIYVSRGLNEDTAREVAKQLTVHNALEAHARDELGINEITVARPLQAAFASAVMFSIGAALPLAAVFLFPHDTLIWGVTILTLFSLAGLGALGAVTGGAHPAKATIRVTFWGAVALAATALIGYLFGVSIS